jgi:hypothetical protein
VQDCPLCRQLADEWNHATTTLRRMRRSAIVWEYEGQIRIVEERHAAYLAHQRDAHPGEPEHSAQAPRPLTFSLPRPSFVRRSNLVNVGVGIAVIALVALVLLLHVT